jgi:hypothetical protein
MALEEAMDVLVRQTTIRMKRFLSSNMLYILSLQSVFKKMKRDVVVENARYSSSNNDTPNNV